MKTLFFAILSTFLLIACEKEEIKPYVKQNNELEYFEGYLVYNNTNKNQDWLKKQLEDTTKSSIAKFLEKYDFHWSIRNGYKRNLNTDYYPNTYYSGTYYYSGYIGGTYYSGRYYYSTIGR